MFKAQSVIMTKSSITLVHRVHADHDDVTVPLHTPQEWHKGTCESETHTVQRGDKDGEHIRTVGFCNTD